MCRVSPAETSETSSRKTYTRMLDTPAAHIETKSPDCARPHPTASAPFAFPDDLEIRHGLQSILVQLYSLVHPDEDHYGSDARRQRPISTPERHTAQIPI